MIEVLDKGIIDYGAAWDEQQRHFNALLVGTLQECAAPDGARGVLMLCEHPHVYTLGKSGHTNNLLVSETFLASIGASYYHIDRGGDITYHGYGQLVGYPILDLSSVGPQGMGLKEYIHLLEQTVITTLSEWGIEGRRLDHATGVWLPATDSKPERKICAIGVKASRFVTMHGFALNVTTDLNYFNYINPCGFTDKGVTSMAAELSGTDREIPAMEEVKKAYVRSFMRLFGAD